MPPDLDQQETIRKGEQWANEIQRKLSRLTAEKLVQMDEIAKDHISWFEQHDTIDPLKAFGVFCCRKLLEAKKPYHFSGTKRADNTSNTNNDNVRDMGTPSSADRRRGSNSSDGSMKTASEMNDDDGQDDDRVRLVQTSRHHINTATNNNINNSSMRMSSSFHRNSGSVILQQQRSSNNRTSKSSTTASPSRKLTNKGAPSSTVTTTATPTKESNEESDSDGMDPDLYPTNIPEWATSPELMEKLKFQKPTDGDKIFGEMVPMEMSVIFGNAARNKP